MFAGQASARGGDRAYGETLAQAKNLLGMQFTSPPPLPSTRHLPQSSRDQAMEDAVAQGGESAQAALQLATLEALEKLTSGRTTSRESTLDELLNGVKDGDDFDLSRLQSSRGVSGTFQIW